jgi:HK97 family phage prohead protease
MSAKYSQAEVELFGREGKAYKSPDGHFSFPVADTSDLRNAIHAVGRAGADHDKVRAYLIGRARALGAMNLIPDNWNSDGSLRARHSELLTRGQPVGMELRAASNGTLTFSGYATVFDHPYEVGSFREVFRPGSFRRTLAGDPDVCLLVNHEGLPLARTSSGTMTIGEDEVGLKVSASLDPDNPRALELRSLVQRGDVREMSLAFSVMGSDGQHWSDDFEHREILAANIHRGDVSVVTQGANDATTISMRGLSLEQRRRTAQELGAKITGARAIPGGIHSEVIDADGDNDNDACPTCEGSGQIQCPACRGTGTVDASALTGAVGTDGLEQPAIVSSSADGQRGVILADLTTARAEVEALRNGERRKQWELEVKETHHALRVGRLRSQVEFGERTRRERMRNVW